MLSEMAVVDRDVVASLLDKPGILGVFPVTSTMETSPLCDIFAPTEEEDHIIRHPAVIQVPWVDTTKNCDISADTVVRSGVDALQEHTMHTMVTIASAIQRHLAVQFWQSVNDITCPSLIDARTGLSIPAVSSVSINCQGASPSSPAVRDALIAASRNVRYIANRDGLGPAEWAIAMHPAVWYELAQSWNHLTFQYTEQQSDGWDCPYCGTSHLDSEWICRGHCGGSRDDRGYVCLYCGRTYPENKRICWDAETGTGCGAMGDMPRIEDVRGLDRVLTSEQNLGWWMLENNKLVMDGLLFNVAQDAHAPMDSVYILPTKVCGDIPAWERQYADQRDAVRYWEETGLASIGDNIFWTDDGEYAWAYERQMWNHRIYGRSRQRLMPRMPQLAARLKGIQVEEPHAE